MTLDDKALEAAIKAFVRAKRNGNRWNDVRAAITAYLKALPIPEGEVGKVVKALHRLAGELPPETRGRWTAEGAADLIIRLDREMGFLRETLDAYRKETERLKRALHENTQSHRPPDTALEGEDDHPSGK